MIKHASIALVVTVVLWAPLGDAPSYHLAWKLVTTLKVSAWIVFIASLSSLLAFFSPLTALHWLVTEYMTYQNEDGVSECMTCREAGRSALSNIKELQESSHTISSKNQNQPMTAPTTCIPTGMRNNSYSTKRDCVSEETRILHSFENFQIC